MRTVFLLLLAPMLLASLAHADPDDLSGGVFIAHAPPGVVYTNETASWCDSTYLTACENQVNRIETNTEAVWFVLSGWGEEKSFSGVEFGLGDFASESFVFMADGLCLDDAMALPYGDWPGPNSGIAIAAQGDAWTGDLVPIYWFAGYNYAEGDTIAITANPATGHAGWLSGESRTTCEAECLGAVGLGADGTACCPAVGLDQEGEDALTQIACCLDGLCILTSYDECLVRDGTPYPNLITCSQDICDTPNGLDLSEPYLGGLTLILMSTPCDFVETALALREEHGLRILVGIAPNGLICYLPYPCNPELVSDPRVYLVTQDPEPWTPPGDPADPIPVGNIWDVVLATWDDPWAASQFAGGPCTEEDERDSAYGIPYDPLAQTSLYLIGDVGVSLILPESEGTGGCPAEDWTGLSVQFAVDDIVLALAKLADYTPDSDLSFFIASPHLVVPVPVEPMEVSMEQCRQWMCPALSALGYPPCIYPYDHKLWGRVLCNDQRRETTLDWHFIAYIVKGSCPGHEYFPGGYHRAFASHFGPYIVVKDTDDGIEARYVHEVLHVFGAEDEYESSACDCVTPRGYLHVPTSNCVHCVSPEPEPCIMYNSGGLSGVVMCEATRGQIGWRDSDADGIFDPIDHPDSDASMTIEAAPGDVVDICEWGSSDWLKRVAVSQRNGEGGVVLWDGVDWAGEQRAPGGYTYRKNGGSDHFMLLNPDLRTVSILDASVGVGAYYQGPHTLTFSFIEGDHGLGTVRARAHHPGGTTERVPVAFDELLAGGVAHAKTFTLGRPGHYELDLVVSDPSGNHNAFRTVEFDAMEGAGVEEDGGPLQMVEVSPGVNPVFGEVVWTWNNNEAGAAEIEVVDVQGRTVRRWGAVALAPGEVTWRWDGTDGDGRRVTAGKYMLALNMGGRRAGVSGVVLIR